MTKAQKAGWRKMLGVEESNVTFLFLGGKEPLVIIFALTFPPGWDPSRGQEAKFFPVHALTEVVRNTQVKGSASGKWKCGAGWRRKASFKTTVGSQGWCNPGG